MVAVESHSQTPPVKRRSIPGEDVPRGCDGDKNDDAIPAHGIGGRDLRSRWIELVSGGRVTATTTLADDDDDGNFSDKCLRIRYGVRLDEAEDDPRGRLLDFVEILPPEQGTNESPRLRDRIMSIDATLAEMQQFKSSDDNHGLAIQCAYEGPYAAQLQLLRTLRPPRSKDMVSGDPDEEKVSCRPPPYDASEDSFLVGPLRLFGRTGDFHGDGEPRERTARLVVLSGDSALRHWDVYHNVSPMDPRGHYLLLPALDYRNEWREQSLTPNDCCDLTYMASTIDPPGSMALSFNSVGAGASQNHIHVHACVCPPPPLLGRANAAEHPSGYAATKASAMRSIRLEGGVSASLLDYPCTCVKLSARAKRSDQNADPVLKEMGDAITTIVQVAQRMEAPHNVTWTNNDTLRIDNLQQDEFRDIAAVDAYVFFRRAELSNRCRGGFRSCFSEMLGVFHSSSEEQLESIGGNMAGVLSDVSLEPRESVWEDVCVALLG